MMTNIKFGYVVF